MKLGAAIEEFIQYKQSLGNAYVGPANILKAFLRKAGNLELHALTTQHGEAFLPINGSPVTNNWFHRYWALRSFFRFANSRGYIQHRILPTSMPDRAPRFVPYIYSNDDVRRLLAVPDSHYPPTCPLSPDTMRTLILVLYGTGLQLGEAIRLKHEDADFRNAALTIRETKFGKVRTGSNREGSRQYPETLPNPTSARNRVPAASDTSCHQDRHDDPSRSCWPSIPMAEKRGRCPAI